MKSNRRKFLQYSALTGIVLAGGLAGDNSGKRKKNCHFLWQSFIKKKRYNDY